MAQSAIIAMSTMLRIGVSSSSLGSAPLRFVGSVSASGGAALNAEKDSSAPPLGCSSAITTHTIATSPPVVTRLSGLKSVCVRGIAPISAPSVGPRMSSTSESVVIFSGAVPEKPPCQTRKPAYPAAAMSG